uniref:Uncharacterized protein n=1 Tax=viral metagenome TaxID=1070528 RepID=A0A6M3LHM8_9ZZZZ
MTEDLCKAHSGIKAKIDNLEANVGELWKRWNGMQKLLFGIFSVLTVNLIILVITLIK